MNRQLRKLINISLNSGHSAKNIYGDIAHIIYAKSVYNKIGIGYLFPEDFKTAKYQEILNDVEKIIKVMEWDKNKILDNFNSWVGLK